MTIICIFCTLKEMIIILRQQNNYTDSFKKDRGKNIAIFMKFIPNFMTQTCNFGITIMLVEILLTPHF